MSKALFNVWKKAQAARRAFAEKVDALALVPHWQSLPRHPLVHRAHGRLRDAELNAQIAWAQHFEKVHDQRRDRIVREDARWWRTELARLAAGKRPSQEAFR